MIRIVNGFFSILKFFLLIISFMMSIYIVMSMYQRLGKSYLEAISIFIPYFLLLLIMTLNLILRQRQVTGNIFYNLTCCMVLGVLILVAVRTIFDDYMFIQRKNEYGMNFQYFSDMIAPLKSMLYLLFVGNLCLIFSKRTKKKVVVPVQPVEKEYRDEFEFVE